MLQRFGVEHFYRVLEWCPWPVRVCAIQSLVNDNAAVEVQNRGLRGCRPMGKAFARALLVSSNRAIGNRIKRRRINGNRLVCFWDRDTVSLANCEFGR